MKMKGLVLTVVLIFGFASVAAAECAWVLWIKTDRRLSQLTSEQPQSPIGWEILTVRITREECLDVKARAWEGEASQYNDLSKFPGIEKVNTLPREYVSVFLKGGGITNYRFLCLPDTIDPR